MNIKDRNRKGIQQQQNNGWGRQKEVNKGGNPVNLYRAVTTHISNLSSQQYQSGDYRGHPGNRKNKSSKVIDQDYDEQQQNYFGSDRPNRNQRNSYKPNPVSLIRSTVIDNNYNCSSFDSKLQQNISELVYSQFSKKYQKEMDGFKSMIQDYIHNKITKYGSQLKQQQRQNLQDVINQINKNLLATSKRQKSLESGLVQNQQDVKILQKKFSQFSAEVEEKIEKLINSNSNAEVATSMKKSSSRNMQNPDYLVELKSSIKDIPIMNSTFVQQLKAQIIDLQQSIKTIKIQFCTIKQDIKNTSYPVIGERNLDPLDMNKFNILNEEINKLKSQVYLIDGQWQGKLKQMRETLVCHEENLQGMNDQIGKVINNQIIPRLKKIEQQTQPQLFENQVQYLKKQVIKSLESMPIIRIRATSEQEKDKMERMKNLPKSQQMAYMLDNNNYILDCFGNFLVDENNQKIKLEEEQVYYLQQIQGIQIKLPAF